MFSEYSLCIQIGVTHRLTLQDKLTIRSMEISPSAVSPVYVSSDGPSTSTERRGLSVQKSGIVAEQLPCPLSICPRPTVMGRYPWVEYLLLELLYFIFFYPTRQHTYRAIIFVAMVYLAAEIYLTSEVADTIQLQYSTGFTIPTHFMFMAHILFAEGAFPDLWRRVRDQIHPRSDVDGRDTPPSSFPLTKKLWWMLDIACGMRMIGWVQEPRNRMPPHPLHSRRTFFQKTFQKLILNIVIADLTTSLLALSPPFDYRVHDPADGSETYLAAVPFLRRIPYVLTWAIGTGASVSTTHNAVALVCVGLGSNPTLWPDIWGSWGDAYTVRKLWGYVRP